MGGQRRAANGYKDAAVRHSGREEGTGCGFGAAPEICVGLSHEHFHDNVPRRASIDLEEIAWFGKIHSLAEEFAKLIYLSKPNYLTKPIAALPREPLPQQACVC